MDTKTFWLIEYGDFGIGWDSDITPRKNIVWGTWYEAARELVKNDESNIRSDKKYYRKISEFKLPDVKRKRRMFYVL